MSKITVFTPTYNRGNDECLGKCYRDLCAQTCKDFIWLIIDDGSIDETENYVKPWLDKDNGFEIKYLKKMNGGTHTGYNKAFDLCNTELIFCLETDDEIMPKAIEIILREANGNLYNQSIGLMSTAYYIGKDQIIGSPLPNNVKMLSYLESHYRYKSYGDKFFVYKMSAIGNYRFPEYEGEKLCSTAAMLLTILGKYKVVNERIYNKSYLEDGYTKNRVAINFAKNPKGFAYFHQVKLEKIYDIKTSIKSAIHYIGCSLLSNQGNIVRRSPRCLLTIVLFPLGYVWYLYLKKLNSSISK